MSTYPEEEQAPQPAGIVERLVRAGGGGKRVLKSGGSAGAASFGAFVLAACGSSSKNSTTTSAPKSTTTSTAGTSAATASVPASFGAGDVGILNYALTLEYLEEQFYAKVVAAKLFTGGVG